jgi:predicted permease
MGLQSNAVGPEFTKALGMRVLAGRDLDWGDIDGRRRVAVVNEAMAQYFFGESNAVGRRFSFADRTRAGDEYEIVGVVSNARYSQVRGTFPRTAYVPYSATRAVLHGLYFQVRATGDPMALAPPVRAAVAHVDSGLAIVEMNTMANHVGDSLWQERLFARLTVSFGGLALILACIGLYGTISFGVGRRRSEIAVRIALGARHAQVLWMVLHRAVLLAFAGVAIGMPLALWSGRFVSSLLFGLTPRDPITLVSTALLLVIVACAAGYLPARRAALVDPALALKQE